MCEFMIKFITDSASDIPKKYQEELDIEVLPIPITIEEKGYYEGKDFTSDEFYDILKKSKKVPATSHINMLQFGEKYKEIYQAGYDEIIHVTISSTGSSMFEAAKMARKMLYQEDESLRSKVRIHIIDSKTYSYGYGFAVVNGAKMARQGKSVNQILDYLDDYFDKLEIYFSVYSLDFAKKSGRIGVAASFVGEMLGLRPVISIIDGKMKIIDKVRGDKNVPIKLSQIMNDKIDDTNNEYVVLKAGLDSAGEDLKNACAKLKNKKLIDEIKIGASIAINTGPEAVGIMFLSTKRK